MTEQHTFNHKETLTEFYARAYVNAPSHKVLVYPHQRGKGEPVIWNTEQYQQYIDYLRSHEVRV